MFFVITVFWRTLWIYYIQVIKVFEGTIKKSHLIKYVWLLSSKQFFILYLQTSRSSSKFDCTFSRIWFSILHSNKCMSDLSPDWDCNTFSPFLLSFQSLLHKIVLLFSQLGVLRLSIAFWENSFEESFRKDEENFSQAI